MSRRNRPKQDSVHIFPSAAPDPERLKAIINAFADLLIADLMRYPPPDMPGAAERYYSAKTAPIEHRAWNRAVKQLRAFKPGREVLVLREDLHKWIEQHPLEVKASPREDESNPDTYEEFRAGILKRQERETGRKGRKP